MICLGIDIGWVNLAFVKAQVDDKTYTITSVIDAFCVDLTDLPHKKILYSDCKLLHSNDAYDKIQHLIQEYQDTFIDVDCVFIERQPITGLVHVEQLLFGYFRDKAQLISPNAMHKFFQIHTFEYDVRKQITTKISRPYLKQFQDWKHRDRLHDMGDAFCILVYALNREKTKSLEREKTQQLEEHYQNFNQTNLSVTEFIDRFKKK